MSILLGCIADDFTGGTDLARMLVKQGARTVQTIGVPTDELPMTSKRLGHHDDVERPVGQGFVVLVPPCLPDQWEARVSGLAPKES